MRKLPLMLAAATMLSAAALSFGPAQATPIAPAGLATAAQSTGAIQQVGWRYHRWHRWHRWGWHRPYWRHRHYWGWRHRGW